MTLAPLAPISIQARILEAISKWQLAIGQAKIKTKPFTAKDAKVKQEESKWQMAISN
jgi:hypothetical protein